MKNFIEELHSLTPKDLPEIAQPELSKGCLRRITAKTHRNIENKPRNSVLYLRRAVSLAAAAGMIMLLSTAVFAYRHEIYTGIAETGRSIMQFFTREEEIIDPKAEIINETVRKSGVELTVEKAVRDGDQTYLYINLTNHDGLFSGDILTCEEYILSRKADYPGAIMPKDGYSTETHRKLGMSGVYAGDILSLMRENPSDSIELLVPVKISGSGSYRFTIKRLMSVSDEVDAEGYTGNLLREVITEELTVDFEINSDLESLERKVIRPNTDFEVSGVTLNLESITVSPLEIVVDIRDLLNQSIIIEGWETEALDCLHHYSALYDMIESDPAYDEDEAIELYRSIYPDDLYEVRISFTDESLLIDESRSYASWGYAFDKGLHRHTFKTVNPVYPEEIAQIYLANINNPDDVIVIWEKQE